MITLRVSSAFNRVDPWDWIQAEGLATRAPTAEPSCCPIFLQFHEILNYDVWREGSEGRRWRMLDPCQVGRCWTHVRLADAGLTSEGAPRRLLPQEGCGSRSWVESCRQRFLDHNKVIFWLQSFDTMHGRSVLRMETVGFSAAIHWYGEEGCWEEGLV